MSNKMQTPELGQTWRRRDNGLVKILSMASSNTFYVGNQHINAYTVYANRRVYNDGYPNNGDLVELVADTPSNTPMPLVQNVNDVTIILQTESGDIVTKFPPNSMCDILEMTRRYLESGKRFSVH